MTYRLQPDNDRRVLLIKFKRVLAVFISTAVLAFVVTAGVTYLYNLIVYRTGEVDWGTAFLSALMLGIVLTYIGEKKPLKKH